MRAEGNRVYVSATEVQDFMNQWPCCMLKGERLWFEFDCSGGLVDIGPGDTSGQDGGALLALSEDAGKYLESKRAKLASKK